MQGLTATRKMDGMTVHVFQDKAHLGAAAAARAAQILRDAVEANGEARVIVATGNSQLELIEALVHLPEIPWLAITVFHMDEYVGLSDRHPASFRKWIRERVIDQVHPKAVHYLDGDAGDIERECARYASLLLEAPIDVAFVGIGENGHIAFNDPHVADFLDPEAVKRVTLDAACRRQQVGEGHFASQDEVPREALTLTCPALMRSDRLVCCVPDERKARAVQQALEGPVAPSCPASLLRAHTDVSLYLDVCSAMLLTGL